MERVRPLPRPAPSPRAAALPAGPLLLLLLLPSPAACSRRPERPNLLLVTLDTTRRDHLSCYGYDRETSPNLDRLAREGQKLERAWAVSSWTLPTHASLFTGLYPSTHGAHAAEGEDAISLDAAVRDPGGIYREERARALPEEAVTLAEVLRDAGYATGGVAGGPWLEPVFGLAQGFEFYDGEVDSTAGRRGEEVNARALAFLREQGDGPFFLFVNYFDPHAPWDPPPAFRFRFFPEARLPDVARDEAAARDFDVSQYDGEIAYMDRCLGELLRALRDMGLYDRTWIVVTSDHGELLGEHGLWWHGLGLFEEEVRCPLVIKWPEGWPPLPDGAAPFRQVDLMPLVLERLGIESPGRMEGSARGREEAPVVCELFRNPFRVRRFGARFDRALTAVISGGFKLVLSTREGDPDAGLFSLEGDAGEGRDLSTELPGEAQRLRRLLEKWRRGLAPPLPARAARPGADTRKRLRGLGYPP